MLPDTRQGYLLGARLLRLAGKYAAAEKMLGQATARAGRAESTKMASTTYDASSDRQLT
jgi:hypothetical protein